MKNPLEGHGWFTDILAKRLNKNDSVPEEPTHNGKRDRDQKRLRRYEKGLRCAKRYAEGRYGKNPDNPNIPSSEEIKNTDLPKLEASLEAFRAGKEITESGDPIDMDILIKWAKRAEEGWGEMPDDFKETMTTGI